jgi:DNA-binding SARP family transcriptional activator
MNASVLDAIHRNDRTGSEPGVVPGPVCPAAVRDVLQVRLLGRFEARFGARLIRLQDGSKAQELFVYLLLNRRQAHTREEIAALLWEDADPVHSKAYLRKALWQLRLALSVSIAGIDSPTVVDADRQWLRLHPSVPIWLDVAEIEHAYAIAQRTAAGSLTPANVVELRDAAALYAADLLLDRYQHWCLEERERVKHMYLAVLDKLLDSSDAEGDHEAALIYGQRILDLDSTREHVCRRMMQIHCRRGDRASALHQYAACVDVLASELGVPPMQETRLLYERILREETRAETCAASAADVGKLQHVLRRLDEVQGELDRMRGEVEQALGSHSGPGHGA